ncbi:MAG: hypothetical protein ACJ788_08410, partial [Ktedonobacteraceae bacterium]
FNGVICYFLKEKGPNIRLFLWVCKQLIIKTVSGVDDGLVKSKKACTSQDTRCANTLLTVIHSERTLRSNRDNIFLCLYTFKQLL